MTPPDMGDTSTITNGELFRAVSLIRGDIGDLRTDVKSRPTSADLIYLGERVKVLENWQTWALRLGAPTLIATMVTAFSNLLSRTGN
jgi:hypothetical protein